MSEASSQPIEVRAIDLEAEALPSEFSSSRMRRSLLLLAAIMVPVVAVLWLAPGLSSLRSSFAGAESGWLVLAAVFEFGSLFSYVVIFRAVFCPRMSWRTSSEIGLAELAANSLLSVGGAGGLALGAWILRRGGVPAGHIAKRTVAFFLLTSLANFGFLVIAGIAVATDLTAGLSNVLLLGVIPAAVGVLAIVLTLLARPAAHALAERSARPKIARTLQVVGKGAEEAFGLLRTREPAIALGSVGYMLFDVAALGICFVAFGNSLPALDVLLIAYIIGQLGGLIPLPGGIGGLDLGLIGALVLYGVNATDAAVAVLAYRGLLLAIPAMVGLPALEILRRRLRREDHDIRACVSGDEVELLGRGRIQMP